MKLGLTAAKERNIVLSISPTISGSRQEMVVSSRQDGTGFVEREIKNYESLGTFLFTALSSKRQIQRLKRLSILCVFKSNSQRPRNLYYKVRICSIPVKT